MSIKLSDAVDASNLLSWTACIPTLNRLDVLQVNMQCLLAQTHPPKQVIIVDASQDAEQHRSTLMKMFTETRIEFIFESAMAKSTAVQRNQGLPLVTADIVLFMDDDALLFPNCAEEFMAIFEKDREEVIVGLALQDVDSIPPAAGRLLRPASTFEQTALIIEQKRGGTTANLSLIKYLEKHTIWRLFRREILMQSMDRMFVPYDYYRHRKSDAVLSKADDLIKTQYLPGYGMAVRAHVARAELFNPFLLAYCPCEDLDASYRFGRHGICAHAPNARLKHYEVEGSRITRSQATSLGVSNVAFFIHTNSDSPIRHRASFTVFVARRLLGEILKDLLARRLKFPQARGVAAAIPRSFGIFRRALPEAQKWYFEQQREFLNRGKTQTPTVLPSFLRSANAGL
jgi:GT2 family glycosyltransferase